MDVWKDLYKYVVRDNMSKEDRKRIKSYSLERYFYEGIREVDKECYNAIMHNIDKQKRKNEYLRREVIRLSEYFERHNIDLVHMKGIVLAEDIYNDCPQIRKCNDIDVLVAPQDTEKALDLLGDLGYIVEMDEEKVSSGLKIKYYNKVVTGAIHFPEFYVKASYMGVEEVISMDFHIAIAHTMQDKERKMNQMVQRCEKQLLESSEVKVLEIHDRFIQLALHFAKEMLRNKVRWCIIGNRKVDRSKRLNLALLHDMALLLQKYKEKMNWDIIRQRALELNGLDEIIFVMQCLRKIYVSLDLPELDQTICSDDVYKLKLKGAFYPIQLIQMNTNKVLIECMDNLAKEIMTKSEDRDNLFYSERKYYINKSEYNGVVGCALDEKDYGAVGTIKFLRDKGICFRLQINNKENFSYCTFTLGSSSRKNIFCCYINKFKLNLNEYDQYRKSYTVSINNAYTQAKFSFLAEECDEYIEIHIPEEIIGNELVNRMSFLFDIDFPEWYNGIQLKEGMIPKYKLNDISFPYNPDLLYKIVLEA